MAWLIGVIGDLLFRIGLGTLTVFARASAWNVALATLTVVAVGALIATFISVASTQIGIILTQTATFPAIPYFLPSNLTTCLTAYITVKIAGTVFNSALHFIENRSYILKA